MKDPMSQAYDDGEHVMQDTDLRPRRISSPEPIELYILKDWDGADGRANRTNGYIVRTKQLAEEWVANHTGSSYQSVSGIVVGNLTDIPQAKEMLARQKALAKLTPDEKKLLGL